MANNIQTRLLNLDEEWATPAAGETFVAGDLLIWDNTNTTGGAKLAAAADNNIGASGANTRILGFALQDAVVDGQLQKWVPFKPVLPGVSYRMQLFHGTPASAIADPLGQLGTAYEIRNATATGCTGFAVALDATTNTKCVVVGYDAGPGGSYPTWTPNFLPAAQAAPAVGTTQYPYAWVNFLDSACVYGSAR